MRHLALFLLTFSAMVLNAQSEYTLSGSARDSVSGEALIGASVFITELKTGCTTNAYGFYSITVPPGDYIVRYDMLGYTQQNIRVHLNSSVKQNIVLTPKAMFLNAFEVRAQASNHNVVSTEMSAIHLDIKEISAVPVLFGEQDILKTIQLLPGIKSAGEGTSGFYVRGGTTDQNLVLLDEAPVYNTSHLLGFFSIFNSDAIKDVNVLKGGIPAEYGGRLSSVVDIRMKDGNYKDYHVSGGIGLISSRLTVEGPIVKDKGSFIISGRRTYADLFLKLSSDSNQRRSTLYFYDLNLKANYRFNDRNQVFLSGYLGRDVFNFGGRFGVNWGNTTGTFRWNHLFSDKLFLNSSLIYSDYNYINTLEGTNRQVEITAGIKDYALKEDFQHYLNSSNTMKFGLQSAYHTFSPGSLMSSNDTSVNSRILDSKTALENGLYLSDEQKIGTHVVLNLGARLSSFSLLGPGTFFTYDGDGDKTDSTVVKGKSFFKTYYGFEPRLSVTYIFNEKSSIKASYMRINQYVHLLSNTTSGNPNDLWLPTSNNIKPQISDQWATGYFRNFDDNNFETSVEVYYKNMQNIIDYKNGADIVLNPNVESQLLYGKGWAYGAEFFVKKKEGRLTGWVGYTISRTLRQFNAINDGNTYPARQDQIHDISIVGIYKLTPKWTIGSTWVFNTGDAVTFPSGLYSITTPGSNTIVSMPYYTERNGYRMPNYHRLDLSATRTKKLSHNRESSWNFSVYNLYARRNAYAIYFQPNPDNKSQMQAVQLSLFRFVPSVTYNFKF